MDSNQLALQSYALHCDITTLSASRQRCESLANRITKLISLMERYSCEDGNIESPGSRLDEGIERAISRPGPMRNGDDPPEVVAEIKEEFDQLFKEFQKAAPLGDENDTGLGYVLINIAKRELTLEYGKILGDLLQIIDLSAPCSSWTLVYLENSYRPLLLKLQSWAEICRPRTIIPGVTVWRQLRRILWDVSDELNRHIQRGYCMDIEREFRPSQAGRPVDFPTLDLIFWARCRITIGQLASMLVEADLDRDRTGSRAVRIRRERKRLVTFEKGIGPRLAKGSAYILSARRKNISPRKAI